METTTATGGDNGVAPMTDDAVVASLRERVSAAHVHADELRAQLDEVLGGVRRYEKALTALTGEVPVKSKPGPKPVKRPDRGFAPDGGYTRGHGQSVGGEKLAAFRAQILEYAKDHDEFSQVEFRSSPSGKGMSSGMSSLVFDALRQGPEPTLRIARQGTGTQKWYRLTRQAQKEITDR